MDDAGADFDRQAALVSFVSSVRSWEGSCLAQRSKVVGCPWVGSLSGVSRSQRALPDERVDGGAQQRGQPLVHASSGQREVDDCQSVI